MTDTGTKKENNSSPQPKPATLAAEKPDGNAQANASNPPPAASKKEPAKTKGPWMYVGPTLPGIGIQNRVYAKIPEEIRSQAEETPEIPLLFILVKDYPMANRMLREKTGYIYHAYCKIAQSKKGGKPS